MNPALWAALGAVAALLLVVVGIVLAFLLGGRRAAQEHEALASARADVEAMRAELDRLSAELAASRTEKAAVLPQSEFVITTVGRAADRTPQVPERAVLSVTVGEPLVKLAAFGCGLRRALSAESRNRIAFEMRREVKRARKERRRAARRARVVPAAAEERAA